MTAKLIYRAIKGEFAKAIEEIDRPIAEAASRTIREAGENIKTEGRAEIARAGFSRRWQNTWRVDSYPQRGKVSIDAAAFAVHRIPYAAVFQTGGTIRGKPRLFVPLANTPKRIGRRKMTPENFTRQIGKLSYLDGPQPLLAAPVNLSRPQARKERPKISVAGLRRGAAGQAPKGVIRTVPLFVGLRAVRIPKKFGLLEVVDRQLGQLADLYAKHLRG